MKLIKSIDLKDLRTLTIIFSSLILVISFFFNAFIIEANEGETEVGRMPSIVALLTGWFGAFTLDPASLSWLANLLLFLGWELSYRKQKLAIVFSITAMLVALSFLLCEEIIANEGGGKRRILFVDTGFYLWLAAIGLTILGFTAHYIRKSPADN